MLVVWHSPHIRRYQQHLMMLPYIHNSWHLSSQELGPVHITLTPLRLLLQAAPLADLIAFNKVKRKLGGKVRLILSGAAPLSRPVQEVLSVAMCAPVLQGYGLTETCAASSIAEPYKWDTIGTVGGPMPGEHAARVARGVVDVNMPCNAASCRMCSALLLAPQSC
jgi:long-subunit acyl-CoA synthetase (AMP-forming)